MPLAYRTEVLTASQGLTSPGVIFRMRGRCPCPLHPYNAQSVVLSGMHLCFNLRRIAVPAAGKLRLLIECTSRLLLQGVRCKLRAPDAPVRFESLTDEAPLYSSAAVRVCCNRNACYDP